MKTIVFHPDVHTYDIDFMGHLSNIAYIRWLEVGRCKLLDAVGCPISKLAEQGSGPVLARTEIDYRRPILLDDQVEVEMWISELTRVTAWMDFEIRSHGTIAAKARQRGVFVNLKSGRPERLTSEQHERFLPFVRES